MIRAVVFDLWNTLVHSRQGDPFRQLHALLSPQQREHFPALKRDAMVQRLPDADALIQRWRFTLGLDEAQVRACAEVFRDAAQDAACFPEARDALQRTRRLARIALLSNTQSFDMEFLERLGLQEALPSRFLSAHTGFLKPDPEAFQTVQKSLGLFPGELVMVGDSWTDDVLGALRAGWVAIWVNRAGAPRPEVDPEAELVEVPDLSRVPEVVENLQAGSRCASCLG